jgi:DNA-binding PucR family transcriptional regulator
MPAANALLSLLRAEEEGLVRKGTARRALLRVLKRTGGNFTRTATDLHVHPDTIRRSVAVLGLEAEVLRRWPARRG